MTISNEAVEVAAEAAYKAQMEEGDTEWKVFINVNSSYLDYWRDQARAALEAAAGIIRAECLAEAAAAWDTRTATLLETMKGMAESREYGHDEIMRYGAYSAEAQSTAFRLRARAVAERGRQ